MVLIVSAGYYDVDWYQLAEVTVVPVFVFLKPGPGRHCPPYGRTAYTEHTSVATTALSVALTVRQTGSIGQ